jgi:hypothetical protein
MDAQAPAVSSVCLADTTAKLTGLGIPLSVALHILLVAGTVVYFEDEGITLVTATIALGLFAILTHELLWRLTARQLVILERDRLILQTSAYGRTKTQTVSLSEVVLVWPVEVGLTRHLPWASASELSAVVLTTRTRTWHFGLNLNADNAEELCEAIRWAVEQDRQDKAEARRGLTNA